MSEESKKGIYDQSSFDAIKPRLNGTKPKYPATPLENWNDAPGRRDAQFENHCSNQYTTEPNRASWALLAVKKTHYFNAV